MAVSVSACLSCHRLRCLEGYRSGQKFQVMNQFADWLSFAEHAALALGAFGLPFAALSKILYPTYAGMGRPLLGVFVVAPATILNVTLSILLSKHYGTVGVAVSLVFCQFLIALGMLMIAKYLFSAKVLHLLIPAHDELIAGRNAFIKLFKKPNHKSAE